MHSQIRLHHFAFALIFRLYDFCNFCLTLKNCANKFVDKSSRNHVATGLPAIYKANSLFSLPQVTKPSAQIGFIRFVLIPLFEALEQLFPVLEVGTLYACALSSILRDKIFAELMAFHPN